MNVASSAYGTRSYTFAKRRAYEAQEHIVAGDLGRRNNDTFTIPLRVYGQAAGSDALGREGRAHADCPSAEAGGS
jgi:hypothetical protein